MVRSRDFTGAKIALVRGRELVVYRRDRKEGIPYPDHWDLPGGGREGDETPESCALREVAEEFGLTLSADRIVWSRCYPSLSAPGTDAYFFVAPITDAEIAAIRFGDEGQYWAMMALQDFMGRDDAIPYLRDRLAEYSLSPLF